MKMVNKKLTRRCTFPKTSLNCCWCSSLVEYLALLIISRWYNFVKQLRETILVATVAVAKLALKKRSCWPRRGARNARLSIGRYGGMPHQKILKSRFPQMAFPAFWALIFRFKNFIFWTVSLYFTTHQHAYESLTSDNMLLIPLSVSSTWTVRMLLHWSISRVRLNKQSLTAISPNLSTLKIQLLS